jgi:hypothetical protein
MEYVEDPSEEEIEYCTPPEIQDKAHDVSHNLLPEKSRGKYSKSSHERTPSVANFLSVQQRCPLKRNTSGSKEKNYVGHNIK